MVQSKEKSAVYLFGGLNFIDIKEPLRRNEVYELHCQNGIESCEWKLRHHLSNPRSDFVAVPLPENNPFQC